MSDWQPIETAPKDGTHILLWIPWVDRRDDTLPEGFMYLARWSRHDDPELDRWIDPTDDDDIGVGATHWMPLPTPPKM